MMMHNPKIINTSKKNLKNTLLAKKLFHEVKGYNLIVLIN